MVGYSIWFRDLNRLETLNFQADGGGGKEAEVIFREHVGDDVDVADGLHLLRVVGHDRHVHRQEEENHLLGRS